MRHAVAHKITHENAKEESYMNLKDVASQLNGIAQSLVEMQAQQDRQAAKKERWTIRGKRADQDWKGETWFTDVYAADESEAWEQFAWLVKAFHMSVSDVSIAPGKTEEYKQWEQDTFSR